MHRRLFLLMGFVVTHSLYAMDRWLVPVQMGKRDQPFEQNEKRFDQEAYHTARTQDAIMGDTFFTAQCFLKHDFDHIVAKPSIKQAHTNLLSVPYKVLDAVQKQSDENTAFTVNFASVPDDMRYHVEKYVFEGNKNAIQTFNDGSYGQSMLNCAYAMEGVKKNRISWLTEGEQLGICIASPNLRKLCVKLNTHRVFGIRPKLTLYEEYLIANEMPQSVAKKLSPYYISCQLPYTKRLLPALKAGMHSGAVWEVFSWLSCNVLLALPIEQQSLLNNAMMSRVLGTLYYASNKPCLILPSVYGMTQAIGFVSEKLGHEIQYNPAELKAGHLLALALVACAAVIDHKLEQPFNSHKFTPDIVAKLIGGTAGFLYGTSSSLYNATQQYPLQKTIGSIAQQNKK